MTVLIPLPRYYNPDDAGNRREIEDEKLTQTAEEVALTFEGAGTLYRYQDDQTMRGVWWNKGILYRDVLVGLEVDVLDTPENRAWFEQWALDVLLDRFQQHAIYVKFVGGGATVTTRLIARQETAQAGIKSETGQ